MATSAAADAPTLSDATLTELLAAVQTRFDREYTKTIPADAESMSDKVLAKTWVEFDAFARGFARVADKYSDNRKVLAAEMSERGFEAKDDDRRIVGTVIGLTRRLFARVIARKRTTTNYSEAWDAFYATTAEGSPERALLDQIKANKTKTTTTLGFELLDHNPAA